MLRTIYTLTAAAVGVLVGGLLAALSGHGGVEAVVEIGLCAGIFALCGFFAKGKWFDEALDFMCRSLDLWF